MKKKRIAMILSAAFAVASIFALPAVASAEPEADTAQTQTRGVYWFGTHEVGEDLTDTYIFDDSLLTGDSKPYNQKLATMSYELAVASISTYRADYPNKSWDLRSYLTDNGFVDFDTNQYYKERMTTETMGAACAHKKIVDQGKEYTLLAIVPRSAGYEAEWGGNFVMGESGDHAGFKNGKEIVLSYAREYIEKYGITGDIKVWTAGYSRGAGVTNQIGADLIRDPQTALGSSVTLKPENLYCYTFGTPRSADANGDYKDAKFAYIHNTYQSYDIVTALPPANLGFDRYGTSTSYADRADKNKMLQFLQVTNPNVYELYTTKADPDNFAPKKFDAAASFKAKQLVFADDPESYLPKTQEEYMKLLEDSIAVAAGGKRAIYHSTYEEPMRDLCGYYFSHLDAGGSLMQGIKESKYSVPMVISMYVYFVTDRYKENVISDADREEIQKAMADLKEIITALQEEGVDVPSEYLTAYNNLADLLKEAERYKTLSDASHRVAAILYSHVMKDALTNAKADPETLAKLTSDEDSWGMSHLLSYLFLYNSEESEAITYNYFNQQFKHMATFMANSSSFMPPHFNEVILSWLRTLDSNYADFVKENDSQKTGYRRVYIPRADLTGTVLDQTGKAIATFTGADGAAKIQSSDPWIGITTCDTGSWLRLPLAENYRVEFKLTKGSDDLALKLGEYDVYEGVDVTQINWMIGKVGSDGIVTLTSPAFEKTGRNALPTGAAYTVTVQDDPNAAPRRVDPVPEVTESPLAVQAIAKGGKKAALTWNGTPGADHYVVYLAKSSVKGKTGAFKAVKTLKAAKTKLTLKKLKKKTVYSVMVEARQQNDAQVDILAESQPAFFVTGNAKGKFTNPKKLTVKTPALTLNVGETAAVKGKVTKAKAGKKFMTKCAPKLRFISSDPAVAAVDEGGSVTAASAGKCQIWIQTINGIWGTVDVAVK